MKEKVVKVLDAIRPALQADGGDMDVVSIVGTTLIMSVEDSRGRVDCGLGGVGERISKDRFRGVRIFDISDIARPRQVAGRESARSASRDAVARGIAIIGSLSALRLAGRSITIVTTGPLRSTRTVAAWSSVMASSFPA